MPLSSPKQSSKKLPSSHLIISDNPESNPNSESSSIKGEGGEGDQSIDQSITAGPSSPTRRRPNSNRRRSSSITAAAQLMSSYSSNHNRRRGSKSSLNPPDASSSSSKGKSKSNDYDQAEDGDDADEHHGLLEEYEEFLPHPSQSYKPRRECMRSRLIVELLIHLSSLCHRPIHCTDALYFSFHPPSQRIT